MENKTNKKNTTEIKNKKINVVKKVKNKLLVGLSLPILGLVGISTYNLVNNFQLKDQINVQKKELNVQMKTINSQRDKIDSQDEENKLEISKNMYLNKLLDITPIKSSRKSLFSDYSIKYDAIKSKEQKARKDIVDSTSESKLKTISETYEKDVNKFLSETNIFWNISSKITDGGYGKIFQAKNGDIYVMGNRNPLQVLKAGTNTFADVTGSNITNGGFGTIFQAKNGDIYAMGNGTGLQVLKADATTFTDVASSNITNGNSGKIFQAKNGDIYAMGHGTPLQVLKAGTTNFTDVTSSNITNGSYGKIFQAKNGDIYAMGDGTPLQVLKADATTFTDVASSKITNGGFGTIFQAKNGDIYAMANGTPLQVLYK